MQLQNPPSKTFAKIAERVALSASGCSGGEVQWSTGETGDSITVRPLEEMTYMANCMVNGASVCENSVTITVDNLPPDDIVCPQLVLTATPSTFEGCANQLVTVKPSGCPASATISWWDGTVTQGGESRSFQLNKTTKIRGTCISIYDTPVHPLQSTAELEVTAQLIASMSVVSPVRAYAGYPVTISAFGCYTADCKDGNYRWENKTIMEPILYGASVNVKVTRETTYEVSCNGLKKTVKIEMKEPQNCDRSVQNTTTVNGYSKLTVNNKCDSDYSITWFDLTSNTVVATNSRSLRVKQTNEILPYLVICATSEGIPCSEVLFTSMQPNVTSGGEVIKEEVFAPNPCKDLEINAIKTMNSPSSILYLQSGFCPGIVQWFSDESKSSSSYIATIRDGERHTVGKITSPKTYYYTCSVSGAQCEGSATANPATSSAREAAVIATNSTIIDAQCSSTISLAKAMEEYYSKMLCQDVNLYKGNKTKSEDYLDLLLNSTKEKPIGASIKYPTNTDEIISAMVLGECEKAGGLMGLPNGTKESLIAEFNELRSMSYSATKNDIAAYNEIEFWGEAPVDIEKTLQKAIELSKKYYVNEAGELVVRKGASKIAARLFGSLFGTVILVFDPTDLGTDDVLPPEYHQQIVDDLLDTKYPDNKIPLATDVNTKNKEPRKYVTYLKTKTNSDRMIITYSGRTSGPQSMTDEEIVALRDRNHHKSPEFGPAVKYKSSVVRYAVRGLEQQMIDYFGKAKSEGGKSGNDIRGVGVLNPRCRIYHSKANSTFGSQLYPHTCK